MKPFHIIALSFFGIFALIGLLVFAGSGSFGGQKEPPIGPVVIWGILPKDAVESMLQNIRRDNPQFKTVTYTEVFPEDFHQAFTEAVAVGKGPDLVLLSQEFLLSEEEKLSLIPDTAYTRRDYLDTFAQPGEIFLVSNGTEGLPVLIDPLVMFYNRDLLDTAGIANPPQKWESFFGLVPKVSRIRSDFSVARSFVALGTFDNIPFARDILSALFFQAGTPIVQESARGLAAVLADTNGGSSAPTESSLRFYTEFANPKKTAYSWSPASPSARDAFIAGDLALYFAPASEEARLRNLNPNLNFDVAPFPQPELLSRPVTAARVYAYSIPRTAKNPRGALNVAVRLTQKNPTQFLADTLRTAPARRDLLVRQKDPMLDVYYRSALIAKSWLSPQPQTVDQIFGAMVNSVITGKDDVRGALLRASQEIQKAL